jgi:hypothetical protein
LDALPKTFNEQYTNWIVQHGLHLCPSIVEKEKRASEEQSVHILGETTSVQRGLQADAGPNVQLRPVLSMHRQLG